MGHLRSGQLLGRVDLVIECDRDQAGQVEAWLVGIMLEAAGPFLAPVPAEVSASIGTTWGGGEVRAEKAYRGEDHQEQKA
jgi:hypothetical protein